MALLEKNGLNAEVIPIQNFITIFSGFTGNSSRDIATFLNCTGLTAEITGATG